MKTIDETMLVFLDAQKKRLKQRTYNDYESVIELFQIYLNTYAYQYLDKKASEEYQKNYMQDNEYFTKTFGLDQLSATLYGDFFEYFIIRKVASGESFMKSAVRVIKKLTKWLLESDHISQKHYDKLMNYFDENKTQSFPNAEKVANLIFELSKRAPEIEYNNILEGYFTIVRIEPKKLWLDSMFETGTNIGPITVTKQISDLCEEGWDIYLVIGKEKKQWTILESGNVYPG